MKKYIDAQLQVVRISNNDIIVTSFTMDTNSNHSVTTQYGADRFRDWEEY